MKRHTKEMFEDISDDDLLNEFMNRFYKIDKNEFVNDFISALEDKDYIVLNPKYLVKRQMLEDFITENDINY